MRVIIVVLGAAAVLIVIRSSAWLEFSPTIPKFSQSPTSDVANTHRLAYHFDTTPSGPLRGIVNDDLFAWTDVHVEVASGSVSFQCPSPLTVSSAGSLRIQSAMCRAANGSVASQVCVMRITANEGSIISAFEPCIRTE